MEVDLEQAPKLIAGLEDAIVKLQDAYRASDSIRNAQSPGQDPYSGGATTVIRTSAGDNPGGYGWANIKAREALKKTIENIKKSIEEYSKTDSAAHDAMKPKE
jgi:hypothetical protein